MKFYGPFTASVFVTFVYIVDRVQRIKKFSDKCQEDLWLDATVVPTT